jgi:hypothetical protein
LNGVYFTLVFQEETAKIGKQLSPASRCVLSEHSLTTGMRVLRATAATDYLEQHQDRIVGWVVQTLSLDGTALHTAEAIDSVSPTIAIRWQL